jgi:diaminopimelate epimerase
MSSAPRTIPFVKASACGNDFLIVERNLAPAEMADLSLRMCDRRNGVGADGVEWLLPDSEVDISARLFNSDGSEAEISGNGTRCVAAYLVSRNAKEKVSIRTGAGVKFCTLIGTSGCQFEFEAAMGVPEVGNELSIRLASSEVRGIPVSMGNPHFVVFVDKFVHSWQAEAAEIQCQSAFPNGVNVELVVVAHPHHIEARFFERGVGETKSSGTGSCASAIAAIATSRAKSPVTVDTPGGTQTVRWDQQVYLRGNAQLICRGEFFV